MGSLFRSEEMSLVQVFIQYEAARATVNELGEIGMIQFRDLNEEVNSFQKTFANEIKRCDEMERKIRFLASHASKIDLPIQSIFDVAPSRSRTMQEMDELEGNLRNLELEITQLNKNEEALNKNHIELLELQHVLRETERFFSSTNVGQSYAATGSAPGEEASFGDFSSEARSAAPEAQDGRNVRLAFVTGVINRDKRVSFERILWRALRGNLYMKQEEIEEPLADSNTGEPVSKNVFVIFCQGEQLRGKIRKLCEAFGAKLYPCPDTAEARGELTHQVTQRISDLDNVLTKTTEHRRRVLTGVAENIATWTVWVKKEMAIYHTMNSFNVDVTSKCFIGEGWCPTADIPRIREALRVATEQTQTMVPSVLNVLRTNMEPPTFNRTNKFTNGFQVIIDAYGVGKYREVNPTSFALISFPFLFAVMFGDVGHGLLMAMAALYMVLNEKKLAKQDYGEIFDTFFSGRYIILLMGIFSVYTGLMYNDMFGKALPIFETAWEFEPGSANNSYHGVSTGGVYALGIDYSWHGSDNMLIFLNSYKMKMSIVFGVVHMSFGIILSCFNHVFYGNFVSVVNEFIPQLLFLESIFGYLIVMIIFKWCSDWSTVNPPSLLNMLINMFLSPGRVDEGEQLYSGQATVQVILLVVALLSVPWMLAVKPLYLLYKHKRRSREYSTLHNEENPQLEDEDEEEETGGHGGGHGEHGEEFDFSEIMIHQVIHTIEFCLGCISNTASYLRLWALSLAHAQLSVVLWDMTFGKVLPLTGFLQVIGIFGAFSGWFFLTLGILLVMEGLSAFLHALRLHWVEFNQKFYAASGYMFVPFSFERILKGEEE